MGAKVTPMQVLLLLRLKSLTFFNNYYFCGIFFFFFVYIGEVPFPFVYIFKVLVYIIFLKESLKGKIQRGFILSHLRKRLRGIFRSTN